MHVQRICKLLGSRYGRGNSVRVQQLQLIESRFDVSLIFVDMTGNVRVVIEHSYRPFMLRDPRF